MRPQMADEPQQRLAEGQRLLDAGDLEAAVEILAPLTGHPDTELSGAAWLSIGDARYRLDDEAGALAAWQQAADRGGATAWLGWRKVAEMLHLHVNTVKRLGDRGEIPFYRVCKRGDRRFRIDDVLDFLRREK
jgi:excisionase family DNA binding protein